MGDAQLTIFGTLLSDGTVTPWRDPGVRRVDTPPQQRDAALARHEERHPELLAHARRIALELAARDGATCLPRVQAEMRRRGLDDGSADQRYLGGVCLPSMGWERTGELVPEGSKARRVAMWRRRTP